MSTDEYRRALEAAIREYEQLAAERQRIDTRLSELAQTISTLSRLCGLGPTVRWGLSDACRTVLRNAGTVMTPAELRDRLVAIGYDLSVYSNALAAIHTTLKRLAEAGELRAVAAVQPGKLGYQWVRSPNVATLSLDNARIAAEIRKSQTRSRGQR
jgi:hypothetical protein